MCRRPSDVEGNGPKRFSVRRKLAVVARLLRGEPLELVARETNVSVAKLTEWRDRALSGAATDEGRERTLKENLLWVRTFDTIEELRAALIKFARHYNETWLVARHGYRTPAQVRADQCRLDQNAMANLKLAA